jgi:hypothetical protein
MIDIVERLRRSISADTPARYPDIIEAAIEAIEHLRASELAWKLIAKQNDRWNALPQSEKEAALDKALEVAVKESEERFDKIVLLRAALEDIAEGADAKTFVKSTALKALAQ